MGVRLMQRMGWKEGKGLGKGETGHASHSVKARKKLDQAGLGAATAVSGDAKQRLFAQATTALFNDVLHRLNQHHTHTHTHTEGEQRGMEEADGEEAAAAPDEGSERRRALSAVSRAVGRRSLYGRFSRAKDTATYSTTSLHEILGTAANRTAAASTSSSTSASTPLLPSSAVATRTSEVSMSEYFSRRMRSRLSGAAVESFQAAHFDSLQRLSAVGRGGLGFHTDAASKPSPLSPQPQPRPPPHQPQPRELDAAEAERAEEEEAAAERRRTQKREERRERKRKRGAAEEVVDGEKREGVGEPKEEQSAAASPVQEVPREGGGRRESARRESREDERQKRLRLERGMA